MKTLFPYAVDKIWRKKNHNFYGFVNYIRRQTNDLKKKKLLTPKNAE